MTVPSEVSSAKYTGTGTTPIYNYTWQIARESDLVVYQINAAGTVAIQLALTTDFTVTGVGVFTGGTVTLTAGNLASGVVLFIASDPEQIQQVLLQQGSAFNPADIMHAVDLLTREVQATRRIANNSVQFPVAESLDGVSSTTPTASERAGGFLAFDPTGAVTIGGGISDIMVSAAMVPVVQAASTAAAFALLGGLPLSGGTMTGILNMGGFKIANLGAPVSAGDAATKTYVDTAVASSSNFIVGETREWNTATPPAKFLMEDGAAVSRTTYAALFAVIGTTFGIGNGTTTFNLPDSRGRVVVGAGTGSGLTPRVLAATGGEETHLLTIPEMPAHTHGAKKYADSGSSHWGDGGGSQSTQQTDSTGGGGAHNNMQPFIVKYKIICYQA